MRLGLLSTARINGAVLAGASTSSEVDVVAVASRDPERAERYAAENSIGTAHGSYEDLLADPDVDAVYVSLPNGLHVEWTIKALEAGKHVLVEKPFDARVSEVERAFDVAEREGLVLSEAFMWRHNPQTRRLSELVDAGVVGDVRLVRASFSFPLERDEDPRWVPGLQGGSLLDVGCYCISGARLVCGEPADIAGLPIDRNGVDSRFGVVLRFPGGALATIDCGFDLPERSSLEVVGADGTLLVADPWHARAPGIEIRRRNGDVERVEVERADSYRLELEDLAAAVRDGRPPLLGRADAVGQARVLEALLS